MGRFPALLSPVLLLVGCDLCLVRANRPPSPVNVTVTQLKANSATVSWDVPEGDVVIGYAILQQRQDGQMQRFIREVNTTNRACVLWDLAEDADYIIQVQSIGLYGESQASKRVHFRTLKETDRLPSNSSNQGDITMEGLDKDRQLQTGEIIIIVAVLLMWAAVIALFCRQYDIIKDNDSNNNKEKTKPSSEHSTPERPSGGLLRSKMSGAEAPSRLDFKAPVLLLQIFQLPDYSLPERSLLLDPCSKLTCLYGAAHAGAKACSCCLQSSPLRG
ncbi:fibronectin type III domain-containing protein 4 isoform X2 [Nyctibius grandis]|uniref:fibronectin type III domain-containing protein 4 isoform X2 n=1 Tax=Nyctibius grandis TaxID=48427 RepID=UPI0035BC65D2